MFVFASTFSYEFVLRFYVCMLCLLLLLLYNMFVSELKTFYIVKCSTAKQWELMQIRRSTEPCLNKIYLLASEDLL